MGNMSNTNTSKTTTDTRDDRAANYAADMTAAGFDVDLVRDTDRPTTRVMVYVRGTCSHVRTAWFDDSVSRETIGVTEPLDATTELRRCGITRAHAIVFVAIAYGMDRFQRRDLRTRVHATDVYTGRYPVIYPQR